MSSYRERALRHPEHAKYSEKKPSARHGTSGSGRSTAQSRPRSTVRPTAPRRRQSAGPWSSLPQFAAARRTARMRESSIRKRDDRSRLDERARNVAAANCCRECLMSQCGHRVRHAFGGQERDAPAITSEESVVQLRARDRLSRCVANAEDGLCRYVARLSSRKAGQDAVATDWHASARGASARCGASHFRRAARGS